MEKTRAQIREELIRDAKEIRSTNEEFLRQLDEFLRKLEEKEDKQ